MIRNLFITLLFFLILSVSLLENSINYQLFLSDNSLNLQVLNEKINLPFDNSMDKIAVKIYPQERFSTNQYLIQDKGFVQNSFELISLLLFRKKNSEISVKLPLRSYINFIHFNPFRSSLLISNLKSYYRLEVNIPDASLEIWNDSEKLENFSLKPPWLRLIFFPFLTSLLLSGFIYYFLNLIKKTKLTQSLVVKKKSNQPRPVKLIAFTIFILGGFVIYLIFFNVFKAMPGFGDEMNYLIQAKVFSAGKFFIKEPPNPEFFKVDWMNIFSEDKKLWNFHPPGNSLILMFGQLTKVDWITIPIIGGLILMTQYLLAFSLFENRTLALINVILMLLSHYFLALASSYMAHASSLLFISLFYLFLIRFFKEKQKKFLFLGSACIGFAFVIRPLSAVLASIVPLTFLLIFHLKEKKFGLVNLVISLLIGLFISSFVFFYSFKVSGRWTYPYLIKGPEVGQTLKARWSNDWDKKLSNLYRNSVEFQNRVHSLGYLFNYVFFLIPVFSLLKSKHRLIILGAYFSFIIYLSLHSFLHWYGWKWEPRMIYDVSFIFFLLSSYGIWQCYEFIRRTNKFQKFLFIFFFFAVLFSIAFFNLPYRFRIEYKDYNINPTGIRDLISKNKISSAIIFFTNDKIFATYSPQNNLNFEGKIIYALSQNEDYDYKLINKYPDKDVYYTYDGNTLIAKTNFYKRAFSALKQDLETNYRDKNVFIVIPWLSATKSPQDQFLRGMKVTINEFIKLVVSDGLDSNTLVVLLDRSQNLKKLLANFYTSETVEKNIDNGLITYQIIQSKNTSPTKNLPLIKMHCFEGTDWQGKEIKSELVPSINVLDCFGENKSIEWIANFDLEKSREITFYLESDDGSEIIVDDSTVLTTRENGKQISTLNLKQGKHLLKIRFFNGPNGEFLKIGTLDQQGQELDLSSKSSQLKLYLTEGLWN